MTEDEARWELIEKALHAKSLSPVAKLAAIGSVVQSRKPFTEGDIRRTQELFGEEDPRNDEA